MTREQKEKLTAWRLNILATFRIDYFRGLVLFEVAEYIRDGGTYRLMRAISVCREAIRLCFEPSEENYPELLIELKQIAKDLPLSDEVQTAIYHVIGGNWEEAIEAINKLRSKHNQQNQQLNEKSMKYIVKNKITGATCGGVDTKGQAGKWVEEYTNEQNEGLSPDAPEYCSPFDFELLTK